MARPLRLFNLDLHISVIEDIRNICKRLYGDRIEITNWSVSSHNWVFGKPTADVKWINQDTWKMIDEERIEAFHDEYDEQLQEYDGFIVTHTPVFAMLFEKYNKPILIINTCRYDQPFCWNKNTNMLAKFHEALKRMITNNQIKIISNNAADQHYLYTRAGIQSVLIPSLCLYTNTTYTPTKDTFVLYGDYSQIPAFELLEERPKSGYSWDTLCSYKGIVHLPYEMSTMSIFEQYWAGVPLFFPSKECYKNYMFEGKLDFISDYDRWEDDIKEEEIDEWLNRADFYLYPFIEYYESFEHLMCLLSEWEDVSREERMEWLETEKKNIISSWKIVLDNLFSIH